MASQPSQLFDALAAVSIPTCSAFRALLQDELKTGTLGAETPFTEQLAHACALVLRPSNALPFVPAFEGASKSPGAFANEELDLLLGGVSDMAPELCARVYDLAWEVRTPRDPQLALLAIANYQESARILARRPSGGLPARDNLVRATALAARMKKHDVAQEIVDTASALFADGVTTVGARVALGRFLVENERGDFGVIASFLRLIVEAEQAKAMEQENAGVDWDWLREIWQLVADAEGQAGRDKARIQALLARAETYSLQASSLARQSACAIVRAKLIRDGMEAFRRVPGGESRRAELHRELVIVQEEVLEEMTDFEGPSIDLSDLALSAMDAVTGLVFREALLALVSLGPVAGLPKIRELAKARAAQSPLMSLVSRATVDAAGRLVRREPSVGLGDPASKKAALRAEMGRVFSDLRGGFVTGVINPARRQVAVEHTARLSDWMGVISDSPIVHRPNLLTWARGLDAGLRGDFVVASYILVPQIEQALRVIVAHTGVLPEWVAPDGVQKYRTLGALLTEAGLREVLGDGFLFEIEALLSNEGPNFRNLLSHGLLGDGAVRSVDAVYLWHLALRLVLLPIIAAQTESSQTAAASSEAERSGAEPKTLIARIANA